MPEVAQLQRLDLEKDLLKVVVRSAKGRGADGTRTRSCVRCLIREPAVDLMPLSFLFLVL